MKSISLPRMRPFPWRPLVILVVLQAVGNLASLPLNRASGLPVEPWVAWVLWTALSVPLIAIGLYLGTRVGLGAPLLEGLLGSRVRGWAIRVLSLGLLVAIVGSLPFLWVNQSVRPEGYPPWWQLVLASVDAGVQEEIFSRLFLINLLVWLGGRIWRDDEGRPARSVFLAAIVLSGLSFGWGHIDDHLSVPGIQLVLARAMLVNTGFGVVFGWLYWRQGLESAILAHFLVDATGSAVVVPVYLLGRFPLQMLVLVGMMLIGVVAWALVVRGESQRERPAT